MDGEVGAVVLLFLVQAQAKGGLEGAVDRGAAHQSDDNGQGGHDQLGHEGDAAQAAQGLAAEDAGRDAAPGAAQAVQGPNAEDVVDLPAVLGEGEHEDEQPAGDAAHRQGTDRVHEVGTGADGH